MSPFRAETPHVRAVCQDGSFFAFPMAEAPSLLAAWQGREAFWSGTDLWGEYMTPKLAVVVCVCHRTQAVLDLIAEEDAERKRREIVGEDAS